MQISTLVTAVTAAGLVETLSSEGPYSFRNQIMQHLQNSRRNCRRFIETRKFRQTESSIDPSCCSREFDAATVIDAINKK
jgi:hypothetical protein